MENFLIFIFALPFASTFRSDNPYCVMESCPRGSHTMCLYSPDTIADRCDRVIRDSLRPSEKQKILSVHNRLRSKVYNGLETRGITGPQPSAVRDVPLSWDETLATFAQTWANQCFGFGDTCRNVADYPVGQNFIFQDYDEDMDENAQLDYLEELIETWYEEVARHSYLHTERFREAVGKRSRTLNFTQLIWSDTITVGCGLMINHRVMFEVPKIYLACNYGPSGNLENEPIYTAVYG